MKYLVFDTSSIITLAMNSLLPTIKSLTEAYGGQFIIPPEVKKELIDNPLHSKKYALEAIITLKSIELGYLKVDSKTIRDDLLKLANSIYQSKSKYMTVVHKAECDALALALKIDAEAYVVDERTTRLLVENPKQLKKLLENKLHSTITINQDNLKKFQNLVRGIKIIRSSELMAVALEKGLLDKYLPTEIPRKQQVEALMWALRLNGCALATEEIKELVKNIK